MLDHSQYEDYQRAQSKIENTWESGDTMTWELEVRERVNHLSLRLGTIKLKGSMHGDLLIAIEESGVRF